MAWSWVGIAPDAASVPVESTTTSITLTEPAGVQANDLLVAIISYRAASTTSVGLPTGWLLVEEQKTNDVTVAGTGSIASGVMAYTVRGSGVTPSSPFSGEFSAEFGGAGGSASPFSADFSADFGESGAGVTTYVFTLPTGISVALGRLVAYRNTNVPRLGAHASTTLAVAATAVVATGLTTTLANDLVVVGMCGARNITNTTFDAVTDPTTTSGTGSAQAAAPIVGTWQERADDGTATGADCGLAIADAVRGTAGATGNVTCTASASARHAVLVASFVNVTTSVYNIHQGLTAWSNHTFVLGERCSNAGGAYQCITAGTSTVAPTGTSADSAPGGAVHFRWLSAIDYTSPAAWNTAMPGTLASDITAYLWNDGEVVLASGRGISYFSHTAGIFRTLITCAPGESIRDKPQLPLVYSPSNGVAFRLTSANTDWAFHCDVLNTTLDGIQFKNENLTTAAQMMQVGDNVTASNSIFDGCARPGDIEIVFSPSRNTILSGCVVIDRQPAGSDWAEAIKSDNDPATMIIENCVLIALNGASPNGMAIKSLGAAGQVTVRNTAIFGYEYPFLAQNIAGSIVFDHCIMNVPLARTQAIGAVSWGSANVGGSLFDKVAANQFINPTSDFRLKAGADGINVGAGDPASLDLYRVARGPLVDIGPAEFVSTAISTALIALGMAGASARAGLSPRSVVGARGTSGGFAIMQIGSPPALAAIGVSAASGQMALSPIVGLQVRGTAGGSAQGSIGGSPQIALIARGTAGGSASMGLFGQSLLIGGTGVAGGRGTMALTVRANVSARATAGASAMGSGIGLQRVNSLGISFGTATVLGVGGSSVADTISSILARLTPDFQMEEKPRVLTAPFGDGYQQITPDGLTAMQRTLTLGWQDTNKGDIDRLVAYFRSHVGKTISFVAPRETAPRQWIVISLHRSFPQPDAHSLSVTLEERLFVDRSLIPGLSGFDIIGEGELV